MVSRYSITRSRAFFAVIANAALGCAGPDPAASGGQEESPLLIPECPAGLMPELASQACVPVGPHACGAGFEPRASGWGCQAIAAEQCEGLLRAELGSSACIPVDDCTAAFPPADAFAVVHDSSELASALAAVPSGGLIALEAGQYSAIELHQSVRLVGRCAEQVVLRNNGGTSSHGFVISGPVNVELRSLSVQDFLVGGLIDAGATATLSHVALANNNASLGVRQSTVTLEHSLVARAQESSATEPSAAGVVLERQSQVTLDDVQIRGIPEAVVGRGHNSQLTLRRSLVSYVGPQREQTLIELFSGIDLLIEESLIHTRASHLLFAVRDSEATTLPVPATVRVVGSELRQVGINKFEILIDVADGSSLELEDTTLHHQSFSAIGASTGTATLKRSVVTTEPTFDTYRAALFAEAGTIVLDQSAIISAVQNAILAGGQGTSLTVQSSLVMGTQFRAPGPLAEQGGSAVALNVGDGAVVQIQNSALLQNAMLAVLATGATHLQVAGSIVSDTFAKPDGSYGDGLLIANESALDMTRSLVQKSADAALVFSLGRGVIQDTTIAENSVGLHLAVSQLLEDASAQPGPQDVLFFNNQLVTNGTDIREGPFGLPDPPAP